MPAALRSWPMSDDCTSLATVNNVLADRSIPPLRLANDSDPLETISLNSPNVRCADFTARLYSPRSPPNVTPTLLVSRIALFAS